MSIVILLAALVAQIVAYLTYTGVLSGIDESQVLTVTVALLWIYVILNAAVDLRDINWHKEAKTNHQLAIPNKQREVIQELIEQGAEEIVPKTITVKMPDGGYASVGHDGEIFWQKGPER